MISFFFLLVLLIILLYVASFFFFFLLAAKISLPRGVIFQGPSRCELFFRLDSPTCDARWITLLFPSNPPDRSWFSRDGRWFFSSNGPPPFRQRTSPRRSFPPSPPPWPVFFFRVPLFRVRSCLIRAFLPWFQVFVGSPVLLGGEIAMYPLARNCRAVFFPSQDFFSLARTDGEAGFLFSPDLSVLSQSPPGRE